MARVLSFAESLEARVVSLEDYESLRETAYLLRSPANARRLFDSIERIESGKGEAHALIED